MAAWRWSGVAAWRRPARMHPGPAATTTDRTHAMTSRPSSRTSTIISSASTFGRGRSSGRVVRPVGRYGMACLLGVVSVGLSLWLRQGRCTVSRVRVIASIDSPRSMYRRLATRESAIFRGIEAFWVQHAALLHGAGSTSPSPCAMSPARRPAAPCRAKMKTSAALWPQQRSESAWLCQTTNRRCWMPSAPPTGSWRRPRQRAGGTCARGDIGGPCTRHAESVADLVAY